MLLPLQFQLSGLFGRFPNMEVICRVVLLISLLSFGLGKKLPSFITQCKQNDPNIYECYKKNVEKMRPYLPKGIPELGIPPCDPLIIPSLELKQPDGSSVGFDANLTNLSFSGGLDFDLRNVTADFQKGVWTMELHFPRLVMLSNYKAKGRVLIVNFEGDGVAHGDYGDVTLYGRWIVSKVMQKGKEHYKIIKDETHVDVKSIKVNFDNLFKGNPEITANTNRLINENTEILFSEIKPIIEKTVSQLVLSVINFVNNRYTSEELYPKA